MKKIFLLITIMLFLSNSLFAELEYVVLDSDKSESRTSASVELYILVLGEVSRAELEKLFLNIYESLRKKDDLFLNYDTFTDIVVFAYLAEEHYKYDKGRWVAMMGKSPGDEEPIVEFNHTLISMAESKDKRRFGLSEKKRESIYRQIVSAEDSSWKKSQKKYGTNFDNADKVLELQEKLYEDSMSKLARKYRLTRSELNSIKEEGLIKNWSYEKTRKSVSFF